MSYWAQHAVSVTDYDLANQTLTRKIRDGSISEPGYEGYKGNTEDHLRQFCVEVRQGSNT